MPVKKKPKKSVYTAIRHPFLYETVMPNGRRRISKQFAKVKPATKEVILELTAAHVRESMRRDGVGNTAKCSVAICTYQHEDKFAHNVEGHTDFQYSRAFLVSKLNKDGFPVECYAYEHNAGKIAKLNDTPGGQEKLLNLLEKNGPLTIHLKPYRQRSEPGRPGAHRPTTGARAPKVPKGARLRYATANNFGATPASE